jgi:DNA primase
MALIKKTSIEDVVAAADMVDVVQGRTQLRKSGARWVGLCPFHSEKTPSFGINPVEKLFYCHGCHKGGDLITFIRETEGLDFAQAVEGQPDRTGAARVRGDLAQEARSTATASSPARGRGGLLQPLSLGYSRRELARGYLAERGLTEEVCRDSASGSPGGEQLAGRPAPRGLRRAGGRGPRQPPRQRLLRRPPVFPLERARPSARLRRAAAPRRAPDQGEIRQFAGGRALPQSRIVYGLTARGSDAKQDEAVVVELHRRARSISVAGAPSSPRWERRSRRWR